MITKQLGNAVVWGLRVDFYVFDGDIKKSNDTKHRYIGISTEKIHSLVRNLLTGNSFP